MKRNKWLFAIITIAHCLAFMALPEGNVHAYPFNPAVNYAAGTYPISVARGDFNGDDDLDLAVANYLSNNVSILLGNGDGTFAVAVNYAVGTGPRSVAVGDFDGDGDLDLAVANSSSNNISILLNNGNGTFATAVNYAAGSWPSSIAVGNFDGDGDLDLAVANLSSNNISILLNNGNGTFATTVNYATGTSPYSVAVSDFDGDGCLDLAAANTNSNNISILLNNGNGTFATAVNNTVGIKPTSVAVGDFDGDGDFDLAVANSDSNNVSRLLGNGDGNFATAANYAVGSSPHFVIVGDFAVDGNPDLAVANYLSNNVSILLGNGDGTFAAAVNYVVGTGPRSIAVGDFDGDGDFDLAVANSSSNNVSILLSTAPPPVTLKSPAHNANVAGTRVVFKWNAASGATRYQLQVRETSDNSIFKNLTLGNVTQRAIADFPADGTQYRWRVRAGNASEWGQWSSYRQFKNPFGAFNHNFNTTNDYQGWVRRPQASWNLTSAAMRTAGQADRWVSARRGNVYYRDLDYRVRMRRTNSNLGEQYVVIRAGAKYTDQNLWHPGYGFGYRNNGTYRVLRLNNDGTITQLKGWTASDSINKNGWNTLRVRAVNNNLRYFINGTLVYNANNSAFARGTVGVLMFRRTADPASTRLLVDWAKMSNPVASSAAEQEILLQETFEEDSFEEDLEEITDEILYEEEESLEEENLEE